MITRLLPVLLFAAGLTAADAEATKALSIYHVGNSLTGDLVAGFKGSATAYASAQGEAYLWGVHFRPATSLTFIFANPTAPRSQSVLAVKAGANYAWKNVDAEGFVPWTTALPGNHWDAVTLQVWQDDDKATLQRDTDAVDGLIKATRARPDNASTRFFVYAPWTVVKFGEADSYRKAYLMPSAARPDQIGTATRDYFRHVVDAVRKTHPEVALIPSGEVILAVDDKMRAGKFAGLTSVDQLHRDAIHLNSIGQNVTAWTAYAVIFGKSPVGLPNEVHPGKDYPPFKNVTEVSPGDLKLIQETVWEVVNAPELRGYTHPGK